MVRNLAAILDLWSRRVVGWACAPTLHASLVLAALHDALKRRRPPKGLLHHSDRGSQYVDADYVGPRRRRHRAQYEPSRKLL